MPGAKLAINKLLIDKSWKIKREGYLSFSYFRLFVIPFVWEFSYSSEDSFKRINIGPFRVIMHKRQKYHWE